MSRNRIPTHVKIAGLALLFCCLIALILVYALVDRGGGPAMSVASSTVSTQDASGSAMTVAGANAAAGTVPGVGSVPVSSDAGLTTVSATTLTSVAAATSTTTTTSSSTTTTTAPPDLPVIAWQPSHQDDTGDDTWHEYVICGDIVERTVAQAPGFEHVIAWETGMGLTGSNNYGGSNRDAFDSELKQANDAGADYFISVHNDGNAPSGVMGMYFEGDKVSAKIATEFARLLAEGLGLPHRDTVGRDLYSLDPVRNHAPIRILLEIGDNVRDRALLEDPAGRAKIAALLAEALPLVLGTTASD